MKAIIWKAYDGKGQSYVAINENDATGAFLGPDCFSRHWNALPGLALDTISKSGVAIIAPADKVGVINKGDYFASRFGPVGFNADDGIPVEVDI